MVATEPMLGALANNPFMWAAKRQLRDSGILPVTTDDSSAHLRALKKDLPWGGNYKTTLGLSYKEKAWGG